MKHEPVPPPRDTPTASDDDGALSAFVMSLPPCPGIPSTPEEIFAADARSRADVAAGRFHDSATVGAWLAAWHSDRISFQDWIARSDG